MGEGWWRAATRPDFDDRQFQRVTLPHTNKVLPWHSFDEKEYQFVSIYRRHFQAAPRTAGPPHIRGLCRRHDRRHSNHQRQGTRANIAAATRLSHSS